MHIQVCMCVYAYKNANPHTYILLKPLSIQRHKYATIGRKTVSAGARVFTGVGDKS